MKSVVLVAILAGAAFGQTADAPPTFESADVHISAPSTNPSMRGGALRGGRYDVRSATMVDLIGMAYRLDSSKIVGGPNWLDWDRFNILAKAPATTTQENLNLMVQNLLADRFKLMVHKDTKVRPAYVLSAGKGKPKLKEAVGSDSLGCQGVPQTSGPGTVPYQVMACHGVTMAASPMFFGTGMAGAMWLIRSLIKPDWLEPGISRSMDAAKPARAGWAGRNHFVRRY